MTVASTNETFMTRTLKNSVSGTFAGVAVCLTGHPFDTVKVRLQTQPTTGFLYNGMLDCFVKTLKWEGFGGLYKGVGSPLVGQMFFRALAFTSYYQITSLFQSYTRSEGRRLQLYQYFVSGAYTGFVVSFVEGPVDLFKTKVQVQILQSKHNAIVPYRNVFHAGYVIMRQHGIAGAYQGLFATHLRNIPACALLFGTLEYMQARLTPVGGTIKDVSSLSLLFSGAMAGLAYWIFIYPVDVIKSSLQSDHSDKAQRKFRGIVDCAKWLYSKDGGWRRFYRGYAPCLTRAPIAAGVMFLVLEKCRQLFP